MTAGVSAAVAAARSIAMFDLRPVVDRARADVQRNLAQMEAAGQYILGPQVAAFEAEFAHAMGAVHSVGVGTGTAAIELCLRAAGIVRPDQDVIVPALTSLFTAQAVLSAGASLALADVNPSTLLLDAASLEQAWTPRTAAVIAVHLYGQPCDLEAISALCRARGAVLIQDACQAHGARCNGRALTDYSPFVAYSFYPTKNLGCLGDGGAVVTGDARIASRLRKLRDGGRAGDQVARAPGINSRLDEMHACYLRAFLPHLDYWTHWRQQTAACYDEYLKGIPDIAPVSTGAESVRHLYVARSTRRDEIRTRLKELGVQTGIHYPVPLHLQPAFRKRARVGVSLWNSEQACREILSLPLGPHISVDEVRMICAALTLIHGRLFRRSPGEGNTAAISR